MNIKRLGLGQGYGKDHRPAMAKLKVKPQEK